MSGRAKVNMKYCQYLEQQLDNNLFVTLPHNLARGVHPDEVEDVFGQIDAHGGDIVFHWTHLLTVL
jgi:hypothetical protein